MSYHCTDPQTTVAITLEGATVVATILEVAATVLARMIAAMVEETDLSVRFVAS